jgi:transketolase
VTARLAVEAGAPLGWERWIGQHGALIAIDRFGASAPGEIVFTEYGFTVNHIVQEALTLLGR